MREIFLSAWNGTTFSFFLKMLETFERKSPDLLEPMKYSLDNPSTLIIDSFVWDIRISLLLELKNGIKLVQVFS